MYKKVKKKHSREKINFPQPADAHCLRVRAWTHVHLTCRTVSVSIYITLAPDQAHEHVRCETRDPRPNTAGRTCLDPRRFHLWRGLRLSHQGSEIFFFRGFYFIVFFYTMFLFFFCHSTRVVILFSCFAYIDYGLCCSRLHDWFVGGTHARTHAPMYGHAHVRIRANPSPPTPPPPTYI